MSGPATVGWCPGALRPMASGDGLILRVKPRGGGLTLDQAATIARLSKAFGNGHLDLTGRANLQIRGARPDTLQPLWTGLCEAGLLDRDAGAEALRNIVASPLAGVDPECFDTRPFLSVLEACLGANEDHAGIGGSEERSRMASNSDVPTPSLRGGEAAVAIRPEAAVLDCFVPLATTKRTPAPSRLGLPAKWSFVIDGGGRLPLADVPADMRFRFDPGGRMRIGLDMVWAEPLAGPLDLPKLLADAAALLRAQPEPMRMKALLARVGHGPVLAALDLRPTAGPDQDHAPAGMAACFADLPGVVGFAPPFGDLSATLLDAIVTACRTAGGSGLRLTPWRVLLATGIADRTALRKRLDRLDLILHPDDPRLGFTTCVGAPACHRATTPTRADAALLAARLGRDLDGVVHLAGCAKGCGRPVDASWTLVGHDGRYDLFCGNDPALRAAALSIAEAANCLSRAERVRIS